jgi:hypothetical protein
MRDLRRDPLVVVDDLERREAELTDVEGLRRVFAGALAAAEAEDGGHIVEKGYGNQPNHASR